MKAEDVLGQSDPLKALDAFRALDLDEKLVSVFAEGAMQRYESSLLEGIVLETRRWGKRVLIAVSGAVAILIGLALSNYLINSSNHVVVQRIEECTTPDTACTNRLRDGGDGTVCAVIVLQNDNRVVNGFDPDHDGTVNTLPVPPTCTNP